MEEKNIDWAIVTEQVMDKVMAHNISFIQGYRDIKNVDSFVYMEFSDIQDLIYQFIKKIVYDTWSVRRISSEFDNDMNLPIGCGLSIYKYLLIIKIIEIDGQSLYIVNIDAVISMPKKEYINKINEEIEVNKLIKIIDPYLRIIDDDELSNVQKSMRDDDWKFIQKYWDTYKDDILNKSKRTKALEYIVKDSNKGMTKVKRLFGRF